MDSYLRGRHYLCQHLFSAMHLLIEYYQIFHHGLHQQIHQFSHHYSHQHHPLPVHREYHLHHYPNQIRWLCRLHLYLLNPVLHRNYTHRIGWHLPDLRVRRYRYRRNYPACHLRLYLHLRLLPRQVCHHYHYQGQAY